MKRIHLNFILISLIILIGSCTCFEDEGFASTEKGEKGEVDNIVLYGAVEGNPDTKTILTGDTDDEKRMICWHSRDSIALYSGSRIEMFVNSEKENSFIAKFEGSASRNSDYYALYPFRNSVTYSNNRFFFEISAKQSYLENSFARGNYPMVGKGSGSNLNFKNLCGILVLKLLGSGTIKSIRFKGFDSSGKAMDVAGKAFVDMSFKSEPAITMTLGSVTSITLDCGNGVTLDPNTPKPFYFVLPPATYSSFEIMAEMADGSEITAKSPKQLTIKRSERTITNSIHIEKYSQLAKEREALIALYNATGGNKWKNKTNWCSSEDVSKWHGIKVNEQGRVREIVLRSNNLSGAVRANIMEAFAELSRLDLFKNQLSALDVSLNTKLLYLDCSYNQLKTLNIGKLPQLKNIYYNNNQLTSIDVTNCPELEVHNAWKNQLTSLDVSNNSKLKSLECNNNQLKTLNMGRHPQLNTIKCYSNQLTSIDVTNCPKLERLEVRVNQLTSLDVSNNPELKEFRCQLTRITSLDLSNNQQLSVLISHETNITRLDLSKNVLLKHLNCCSTPTLTSIDVSNCVELTTIISGNCNLTSLDVTKNEQLTTLYCDNNRLPSLDVRNLTKLENCYVGNQKSGAITLYLTDLQLSRWRNEWIDSNLNHNVITKTN